MAANLLQNDDERQIALSGNFRKRKLVPEKVGFENFINPWTFFALFGSSDDVVYKWLMDNGLMARSGVLPCGREGCDGILQARKRSSGTFGVTFRCSANRNHETTVRKNSFFEKSKLNPRDIMAFIRSYLEGYSLKVTARNAGVSYGGTAVDWGSYMREIFKLDFQENVKHEKLQGIVEIDESLFGRRVKHHRGDGSKGLKVWVFGMVERASNTIILYPVKDRTAETLLPLIQRHVEVGSTIYSDGFASYFDLNEIGYRHFSVLHKYAFRKTYINNATQETEIVNTNRIEGAWKHAKDYFRRMSGTKASQWEGHMAEVMWRSRVKGNVFEPFFQLLKTVYTLREPSNVLIANPLFDSWEGFGGPLGVDDTIEPHVTDTESTDSEAMEIEAADAYLHRNPSPETLPEPQTSPIAVASTPKKHHRQGRPRRPNKRQLATDAYSDKMDVTLQPRSSTPKKNPVLCAVAARRHLAPQVSNLKMMKSLDVRAGKPQRHRQTPIHAVISRQGQTWICHQMMISNLRKNQSEPGPEEGAGVAPVNSEKCKYM